jgi:hypothetical protein
LTLAGLLERSELSAAGFLPIASVPTVHLPAPALTRNPSNGRLRMTMNLQRPSVSGGLSDIPSGSGDIRVNSAGEIELEFLESAPFIRVDAR